MVFVSRSHFALKNQILNASDLIILVLTLNKLVLEKSQQLLRIVKHAQVVSGHSVTSVGQTLFDVLEPREQIGKECSEREMRECRLATGQ